MDVQQSNGAHNPETVIPIDPARERSNALVTKANALIEASYTLSLNEQRIVLACAAQLDGRRPPPKNDIFVVSADEYADLFDIDSKSVYRLMEEAVNRLYERDIRKIEGKTRTRMRWVYKAEYLKGEGKIRLGFSPEVSPYITLLHKRFTRYKLAEIAELNSPISIRIFEMLMQWRTTGILDIEVEDLRERLQLGDRYPRFSNLKQRILDPVCAELTQKTSFDVTWRPIKKGRAVHRLQFYFDEKAQMSLL
jgi:plasmid replication initiation protein